MAARRRVRLAAATALLVLMAACGGGDDTDAGNGTDAGDDVATDDARTPADDAPAAGGATPTGAADADDEETDDGGGETAAAAPEGDPIRIGFVGELSGPFAVWGVQVVAGMQMAIDDINGDGGVDGSPLELVQRDTGGTPEEGVSALEGIIEQDGVVAAGGTISSDVGLATARTAEELETPLFLVKAGSGRILTQESRYTFRTCLPAAPMTMGPVAQYLESEGITSAGAIIADYEWGQSVRGAMEEQLGAVEGLELQVEVAPVPEQDFTTYLRALEGIDPGMIVATGHPPGTGTITRQAAELGLDVPVVGPYAVWPAVLEGVGEAAYGRYADFDCADYAGEEYQELATRFVETAGLPFMEDDAVAGYGIVTMVAEAVTETGGTDPVAIAEYLHGASFDLPGYAFDMAWTEWGELAQAQPILSIAEQGAAPEGVTAGLDWYPTTLFQSEPLEPYVPEG